VADLRIKRDTYLAAAKFARECGATLNELVERTIRAMMSIPPGAIGIVLPLDEADALRRSLMGDRFDRRLADNAVIRIEKANELAKEIERG
jgi:hypothetical protein